MRVVIDARALTHPQSGGFRSYVRGLVTGLKSLPDVEPILYVDREVSRSPLLADFQIRVLTPNRLQADLRLFARQVKADAPDLVHGTMNYTPACGAVPSTVTIHDAMGMKAYPWEERVRRNPREWAMNRYWRVQTILSARRARRIVTVSKAAARELSDVLQRPESRFVVVYNGIQLPASSSSVKRESRTVLAIASPDPRKNLDTLYTALTAHSSRFGPDGAPQLDIVCTSATTAERAQAALARIGLTNYRLLRDLDDQALSNAYASASVFAWPSRLEGFGMPPVEAMQAGTPVVSSSADPMPEVLGESPIFFDPDRPDELADGLSALLGDPEEARRRGDLGRSWSSRYDCASQAAGTNAAWANALQDGVR